MYKYLLLDIDDTLIEYDYSTSYAFNQMLKKFKFKTNLTYEDFKKYELYYWKNINKEKNENSNISSIDKIELLRIELIKSFFDINYNFAYKMYLYYESMLAEKVKKTENYDNNLILLNKFSDIIISTNGNRKQAIKKLQQIKILHIVLDIVSAQDCGYSKSSIEYYDYLFKKLNLKNKEEVLIIGDSLHSDIKGGNLYGIDTCWYNKKGIVNDTCYIPTYEIKNFKQLIKKI